MIHAHAHAHAHARGNALHCPILFVATAVYVDLPDQASREDIMRTQARDLTLAPDVDLRVVAADQRCVLHQIVHRRVSG